jgi:AcrR family transcriptional regulator
MTDSAVMPLGNAVGEASDMVSKQSAVNDGRNRRAAETRRKVIEAAKAMIVETSVAPTVVGVAKRAEVSVRSVFQHFGDVESLFVTVIDSVQGDLIVPPQTPSTLPLAGRVESFTRDVALLYEQIVAFRVAAGQFVGHPTLLERGLAIQNWLRNSSFRVFQQEFSVLSKPAQEGLSDAIGAAMSLEAWVALRRQHKISLERALAAWRLTLEALLAHPATQAEAA